MILILLGPPGAGKGTLAGSLKSSLELTHVSTGDMMREEMKKNSPLGQKVKGIIDQGQLVPDEVVTQIIEHRLANDTTSKGFLLDGFPRTIAQAEDLDNILAKIGRPLDYVLNLESTLPIILARLTGRRVCRNCGALFHIKNRLPKKAGVCDLCGGELYQRADDKEKTIRTRMDVYLKSIKPIVDYYRAKNQLTTLNGDDNSENLQKKFLNQVDEDRKRHKHQVKR